MPRQFLADIADIMAERPLREEEMEPNWLIRPRPPQRVEPMRIAEKAVPKARRRPAPGPRSARKLAADS